MVMAMTRRARGKVNISKIVWKVRHTASHSFPDSHYFIGVVSNRTTDFKDVAIRGLKDAYGWSSGQYSENSWVTVEYKINESKLNFYNANKRIGTVTLPTDDNGIMYWYPCISLRDKDNICQISPDVIVE
eukprot:46798_1